MTDKLPPNLLALFAPRPALRYLPPADHAPEKRSTAYITGVAEYLPQLQEKVDLNANIAAGEITPEDEEYEKPGTGASWLEKRDKKKIEMEERQSWLATDGVKELYKPAEDAQVRGDPFRTLFVSRLNYDTDVKDLEREFNRFGPIERVRIVTDSGESEKDAGRISKKKGKSKGYAFIVFERERDMKTAYKDTDGIAIRGRKILVDVERGRTVSGWKPRRFGGGLGGRGYTKLGPARGGAGGTGAPGFGFGGAPPGPGGFRGGGFDRGGFRGGFDRGGFRGGFRGGDRGFRGGGPGGGGYRGGGGIGYGSGSNGMPPDGAPMGPRGGFGSRDRGGGGYGGGGGSYDDRGGSGPRNANFEPLPPRGGGGGGRFNDRAPDRDRDRDRDGGGGYAGGGQKRPYEGGGGYDDSRSRRRY